MSIRTLAICCIAHLAHAQNWNLSGKVVDAEEGNGLNTVEVSLAQAGLRATTIKNGTWSISGIVGVEQRRSIRSSHPESFLHLDDGRILLRMDGMDIQGRRMGDASSRALASIASAPRTLGAIDTLVYTKDGYVQKRVPVSSSALAGILDSIRRIRGPEWVDSSHSNGFKPDTTDAFPDTLRTLTLRISAASWDRMTKAMTDLCGAYGTPTKCTVSEADFIDNAALIWIPGDLEADGQVWKNVGIRLKGNGSLQDAWSNKQATLPFRINMDKFEDSFPTIRNQRFHGFKKLSLYNSSQDGSDIREAIAGEIFRSANVPASMSVPVHFKLVHGDVAQDLGPYSMVEIPDNPLLNRLFGNDSGNLYKPLSQLDTFVQSEFQDEDLETDYADAKTLIAAINATTRTSAPATWRAELEKAIDMRGWIKWLALSDAIGNWDEYGIFPHNYYLYNDAGLLRWISYDMGWSLVDLTDELIWHQIPGGDFVFPLVDNAMADPVYCDEYRARIEEAISDTGAFSATSFRSRVERYGKMVSSMPSTLDGVNELKTYAERRHTAIRKALASHECP